MEGRGGSVARDGKGNRPFYELPAHVKPCSKIIQETRMQLKYSRKVPMRDTAVGDLSPLPPTKLFNSHTHKVLDLYGDGDGYNDNDVEMLPASMMGLGTVRPVNTQRPFTPRDSVSLWGVSARKRPPSAITLSRLAAPIEDIEEEGGDIAVTGGGAGRPFDPSNSLGNISGQSPLAGIVEEGSAEGNVESVRLGVNSISLVTPSTKEVPGDEFTSKKARHTSDNDNIGGVEREGDNAMQLNNGQDDDNDNDTYAHINNLEVAIEYLRSFVMEYSSSEKPPKADVIAILKRIREALAKANVQPDVCVSSKVRRKLLELIFKLVERNQQDEDILFWSAFVLLHCNIIGNNLTTVFKMVFKSSRSKDYQEEILETEYLEVLMKSFSQICPKTQTESMIYGYGTLKFICGETSVLNRVIDLNLISIMALHLKILNCEIGASKETSGTGRVSDGILNGTFQLTSILRSVVGEERSLLSVVQSGLLQELCMTMTWAIDDIDVLSNIVRILSVMSMDAMCCQVISESEGLCTTVVRVLKAWYDKDDVVVRLSYCLGNLLANCDDIRVKLFEEAEAFPKVLKVMSHYLDKSPSSQISIDVLIKFTRVIANWILNPFVGSEICDEAKLSDNLYAALEHYETSKSEELLLCVLCALNNTSFYINYTDLNEGTMKTAEYLFKNLDKQELHIRSETVKVLGNLTRNDDVRLLAIQYMNNILINLDETEAPAELMYATCGVLINVVVEESVKSEFLQQQGVDRIISVLARNADIMVSLISCQVIWNLIISHENQGFDLSECITPEQRTLLKQVLAEKLESAKENENSMKNKNKETGENAPPENNCGLDHGDEVCNCNSSLQGIIDDFTAVAKDLVAKL